MASPGISFALYLPEPKLWRHLLRASLRECSYLPDPIARVYMHDYVLHRYRRSHRSNLPPMQMIHTAKVGLTLLRRANEGYPRPFEKVMMMSYGRIGKKRHQLLDVMMAPAIPNDADALRELVNKPAPHQDGWEPPEIMINLLKSQMNNGLIASARIRPQVRTTHPVIPEKNSWGKPLSPRRQFNIRRKWYADALNSLLPPLPDQELDVLDGLISGSIPWAPMKRRRQVQAPTPEDDPLLNFLQKGPEKGHTFGRYVNGRPHQFTARFMLRTWRRISSLVPRMHWNDYSKKWNIVWDIPKTAPRLAYEVDPAADLDDLFGIPAEGAVPSEKKTV